MEMKMTGWTPSTKLSTLLRNACFLGWFLCLTEAAIDVFAPAAKVPGVETVLFAGIFPFFFGALAIFEKRKKELIGQNWVPLLFRGVPKTFGTFFYVFFCAVWLLAFT